MTVYTALSNLHPKAFEPFACLASDLSGRFKRGELRTHFRVYETFRDAARQNELWDRKRTQARAWQSAHNYGLAVDFVPYVDGEGWNWDDSHPWDMLGAIAESHGLMQPIEWDRAHIVHPLWYELRDIVI